MIIDDIVFCLFVKIINYIEYFLFKSKVIIKQKKILTKKYNYKIFKKLFCTIEQY